MDSRTIQVLKIDDAWIVEHEDRVNFCANYRV